MLRTELDDGALATVDATLVAGGSVREHASNAARVELEDPDLAARADRGRVEATLADRDRREHVR